MDDKNPRSAYNRRYSKKNRDIRKRAHELLASRMRAICKRDKLMYNSLFTYGVVREFMARSGMQATNIILILLMDLYVTFTLEDARAWGLYTEKRHLYKNRQVLMDRGYVEGIYKKTNGLKRYYLTMKGKNFVKEFNAFYDETVTSVLKSMGNVEYETIRRFTRVKPATGYHAGNKPAGQKP